MQNVLIVGAHYDDAELGGAERPRDWLPKEKMFTS